MLWWLRVGPNPAGTLNTPSLYPTLKIVGFAASMKTAKRCEHDQNRNFPFLFTYVKASSLASGYMASPQGNSTLGQASLERTIGVFRDRYIPNSILRAPIDAKSCWDALSLYIQYSNEYVRSQLPRRVSRCGCVEAMPTIPTLCRRLET